MAIRIQLRRDTAANWVSVNPVLRAGEIGIETDTLKFKIGNGSAWNSTSGYANVTPSGLTNSLGDYILVADQGTPGGPAELDSNGDLIIPENSIILWNDQAHDYTTTLTATQPTANRTITLPNSSGTIALTSDISTAVSNLVDAAPTALDTLNELAAALGDDANFASTITTSIGTKAPIASPTFTGTVSGITKSMVGLGNVDNTTDALKPISTATQEALNLKADSSAIAELAQDAVGNILGSGLSYNDTAPGIGVNYVALGDTLIDGVSGASYGLIGTSEYLDVKNTNGYNKEIELDIASVESKLVTDGFAKTSDIAEFAQDAVNTAIVAGVALTKTYDDVANTITVDLDDTGVFPASYGSTTKIPTFTVDQQGRLTAAGEANVATNLSIAGDTGTDNVNLLTDTVTVTGGTGIDSAVTNNTVTINIDSTVTTNSGIQTLTNKTLNSPAINTPTGIIKSDVGLSNVDNTSDANKPISTATQTALDLKANSADITELAQDAVNTAVVAGVGLDRVYDDASNTYTLDIDSTVATLTGTQTFTNKTLQSPVINTPTGITKSDIGLSNVDNTTDALKPISTATQESLDTKLNLSGGTLTGALTLSGAPTADLHPATKAYVDNVSSGINFHQAVRVATTADITLSGTQTIDGVSLSVGDRVLVKDQTDQKTNGIYVVASSSWSRATDADNNPTGELAGGDFSLVLEGTVNSGYGYVCSNTSAITIGTTNVTYTPFNAAKAVTAGSGLTESTPGTIDIATGGVTSTMIADGTIVNADINASAAIAQSKISGLTQSLANKADVDSPIFTGVPQLPFGTLAVTQAANDDSDRIATTSFVADAAVTISQAASDLVTNHANLTGAHGTSGDVVGTTDAQILTNKTINASLNTLVGLVTPAGAEILTNKTIDATNNTLTGVVNLNGTQTITNKTIDPLTNNLPGVVTLTGTQTLTNKTLTNPTINGANFGITPISVAAPTEDEHAVNRAYLINQIASSVGSDIFPLDDISLLFDGSLSRFQLKYDGEVFIPQNPYKLLVTINGILQILGNQEQHWLSPIQSEGYFFDNDGFIQFGEPVPVGSKFEARYMSGPEAQTAKKSIYPFRAVDIQLGE